MEAAERAEAAAGQVSLFGEEADSPAVSLVQAREWADAERLSHEKTALGFYLSGHPFNAYAAELAPLVRVSLANIQPKQERYLVAGIVTALRVQTGRRGKMAFVTLDDGKGSAEIVVWNETYDAARNLLREDQLVVVEVRVLQRVSDDGDIQGLRIVAEQVYDLDAVRRKWAKRLTLAFNGNASAAKLAEILSPFRSDGVPVTVHYASDRVAGDVELADDWRVAPDSALIDRLREWLAPENVRVVY
jgi:DNA polymerase-3 subunit alpha